MHFFIDHKWLSATLIIVIIGGLFVLWQVLYITLHYTATITAPTIPRTTEQLGSGSVVKLVVMGDSTSIGQGTTYEHSIARMTAEYVAVNHHVELTNFGISGARLTDVRSKELAKAVAIKPDVVLLAVGANDVTHLTSYGAIRKDTLALITQLQMANPDVQIIMTGAPAMGSVARFAPPTQWLAARRVKHINAVFSDVAHQKHIILLPLAAKTAAAFKHDTSLFASDNFHPNTRGYALWQPVIDEGLIQAGYEK